MGRNIARKGKGKSHLEMTTADESCHSALSDVLWIQTDRIQSLAQPVSYGILGLGEAWAP